MSKLSDNIKSKQLGMPFGTATHQLRKQMMLRLLQRLGEDVCHRCGEKIETAEELSMDHVQSWLHVDVTLFWDLDNVKFSHRRCNKPDRFTTPNRRCPQGIYWCANCQQCLPKEAFGSQTRRGYSKECRLKRKKNGQTF